MADIQGYRELSENDLEGINAIKDMERQVGSLWIDINQDYSGEIDPRWMAIAKTHFQEGFMAFVRAIARPADAFIDE